MHSHLIPGIDDGAKTIEDSLELVRFLHGMGYKKLITTPHVMSDYFRNTPEIIHEGLQTVRQALQDNQIPVEIEAAAEYYIDDGFIRKLEEEPLLTFGDKYLLMEVSYINPPDNVHEVFFRAMVLGYKPVLAHPERYPYWYRDMDQYRRFYEMGVTLQLNLNSLAGYYGPDAKKIAEKLIDTGIIGALGTDMHHTRHAAALQKVVQEKYLKKILEMPLINREL
ncbi:MAG: capsular biosynthesis protein [Bacteroidia bacterium]|nr:capsular biosynthesis protein [Bacteroidia bacterium]